MSTLENAGSAAAFPKWLGLGWVVLVWLDVGDNWNRLATIGIAPAFIAWIVWDFVAQTSYVRKLSPDAVDGVWKWFGRGYWVATAIFAGFLFYANHYFPKGPMIDTGDEVCNERGRCGEKFVEDTRLLAVPEWVKFMKDESHGLGSLMLLCFAGCFITGRPKGGYPKGRT